jgi:hypothetical protein
LSRIKKKEKRNCELRIDGSVQIDSP